MNSQEIAQPVSPRNPFPAVDVIIEMENDRIVLVRRKNPPHGWAIPGGFVEYGEPLWEAARREAKEETGLNVELTAMLHVYSSPDRDPRQHVISTVFIGRASGTPVGADDAAEARAFQLKLLLKLQPSLVFDHPKIIEDYRRYKNLGERPGPNR